MTAHNDTRADVNRNTGEIVLRRDDSFSRALEPSDWDAAMQMGHAIAKVGIGGVKTAEEAVIRIMAGREIGLGAMASLRLVYSINGRVAYDATLVRARALQHPECEYFEPGEITESSATFRCRRRGRKEQSYTFTVEDARRAQLTSKDMYKHYARNMLAARATVNLARMVFPEAVAGMYTADELAGGIVSDPGIDPTPPAVIDAVLEDAHTERADPLPDFASLIAAATSSDRLAELAREIDAANRSGRVTKEARALLAAAYKARASVLAASAATDSETHTEAVAP